MSEELDIIPEEEVTEVEVWMPGKMPVSFLRCKTCYLKKSCPYMDEDSDSCGLEDIEKVDTSTGEGIIGFIQSILAAQARRILRMIRQEEVEGGVPDPAITEEMLNFVEITEKLKRILSEEDSLVIRAKGKSAGMFMEKLMGDLKDG